MKHIGRKANRNAILCAVLAVCLLGGACLPSGMRPPGSARSARAEATPSTGAGSPDSAAIPALATNANPPVLPYLAVYCINNSTFEKADPGFALLGAFGTLLALLPDDAHFTMNASYHGTGPDKVRWLQRGDAGVLAAVEDAFAGYREGKSEQLSTLANQMKDALTSLSSSTGSGNPPVMAVVLTVHGNIADKKPWKAALDSCASPLMEIAVVSYPVQGEADADTGNVRLIQPGDAGGGSASSYWASAMSQVDAILKDRMHMTRADATVTREGEDILVGLSSVPTYGVSSLRLFLEEVPADWGASLKTVDGKTEVSPVYTTTGLSDATENRVYELKAEALDAGAQLRLTANGVSNASAPPAQESASPADPDAGMGLPTACCYYRFRVTLDSYPSLQGEPPLPVEKNKPFPVLVLSRQEDFVPLVQANAHSLEPVVRYVDTAGAEQIVTANASELLGGYAATLTLNRAGEYRIQSGVRALKDPQNVRWSEKALTVSVQNQSPEPTISHCSLGLLLDDPTGLVREIPRTDSAGPTDQTEQGSAAAPPEGYGSLSFSASSLFTDTDDPPGTLTYGLSKTGDLTAPEFADTLMLGDPELCRVSYDATTGLVTIQGAGNPLPDSVQKVDGYLMARDGEGATASLPLTVTLTSVQHMLEDVRLSVDVTGNAAQSLNGARGIHMTATMGLEDKPEWLKTLVKNKLTVRIWLENAETKTAVSVPLDMPATGDNRWETALTLPGQSGNYQAVTEASFPTGTDAATSWTQEGWTKRNLDRSLAGMNPILSLSQAQTDKRQEVLLDRPGRPEPALVVFLSRCFAPANAVAWYEIRVLDELDQETDTVRLLNGDNRTDTLCVGYDEAGIGAIVLRRDAELGTSHTVEAVTGRVAPAAGASPATADVVTPTSATDAGAGRGLQTQAPDTQHGPSAGAGAPDAGASPATADAAAPAAGIIEAFPSPAAETQGADTAPAALLAAAAPMGAVQPPTVSPTDQVAVYIAQPGDYTVEVSAFNLDSVPTVYRIPLRTVDARLRRLTYALVTVGALALLTLLGLGIHRARLIPYGDAVLSLKLEDGETGVTEADVPLGCWKKRPVALSHLMLNAMLPLAPWLDDQGGRIRIRPTTRNVRLMLPRAARRPIAVSTGRRKARGRLYLIPGQAVVLSVKKNPARALTLTLRPARETNPYRDGYARIASEEAGRADPPYADDGPPGRRFKQ